jgi:hypothetical protein
VVRGRVASSVRASMAPARARRFTRIAARRARCGASVNLGPRAREPAVCSWQIARWGDADLRVGDSSSAERARVGPCLASRARSPGCTQSRRSNRRRGLEN